MTEHILKTTADMWNAIESGDKQFEVRRGDRGFQKGDVLILCKLKRDAPHNFESTTGGATGDWRHAKTLFRRVKFVLTGGQFGIEPGYVVMSLTRIGGHP